MITETDLSYKIFSERDLSSRSLQMKVNGVIIGNRLHNSKIEAHKHNGMTKDESEFAKEPNEMTFKPAILSKAWNDKRRKQHSGKIEVPRKDMERENMKVRQEFNKLFIGMGHVRQSHQRKRSDQKSNS